MERARGELVGVEIEGRFSTVLHPHPSLYL